MKKRVAIYLRVSTSSQTTENQRRELQAIADQRGWQIVQIFEDAGVSGAKGRDKRPGLDALYKEMMRGKFNVVMAWSIDRLGRSLHHLVALLDEMRAVNCDLYLREQTIDTTTPAGRAMLHMCSVFAEFERGMIVERVKAGLARAKAEGKTLGRPRIAGAEENSIRRALAKGDKGIRKIATEFGVGVGTVQRIKDAMPAA